MAEKKKVSHSKKEKKGKKIAIICIAAVLLIGGIAGAFIAMNKGEEKNEEKEIITSKPVIGTIELTVSGSGIVEPLDRYEIVSLVSGDIISSPFEEGDMVKEDATVFVIDHEAQDKNIESAKNSLTKSKIRNKMYLDSEEFNKTLEKYTVRAEEDGIISDFNLEADDKVTANGKLGTIQNFDEIIATVPFNAAQFEKIAEGDRATVYLYPSMYKSEGTVTYKSYKTTGSIGGAVVYDVEITFDGSSLTLTDTSVSATVHTAFGDVESPASGNLGYKDPVSIFAEVAGEVESVPSNIKNGAKVKKGDVLFVIDASDFLEQKTLAEMDYHDLEINLENAEDRLDDYNIKAPISGTVITKNAKKGDTVSSGNSTTTLMVIADMSAMKFTFQADETDIDKIELGQEVKVTADAVENKIFYGKVESIATEGVASNGVSYYDVEVVIEDYGQDDESGALRSGMNVSAEIVYEKSENALCLPVSAVTTVGDESYVFVKGTPSVSGTEETKTSDEAAPVFSENDEAANEGMPGEKPEGEMGEMKERGDKPSGADMPSKAPAEAEGTSNAKANRAEIIKERIAEATPEGFTAVKVTTGASNGVSIAILSGISENDEIYLAENDNVQAPVSSGSETGLTGGMGGMMGGMPGGMGGGMPGGGMPGGGMGGGNMGGGMRR